LARAREYQIVPTGARDAAPFPTSQALTTWRYSPGPPPSSCYPWHWPRSEQE